MKSLSVQFGYKITNTNILIAPCIVFLSCFALSFITGSLAILPQTTKATTGLVLASTPTMSLTTSTNTVNLQIIPTTTGTLSSSSHNLTATTNMPTGYNLSLTTTTSPPTLTPTTGTFALPTALTNNTWGYAIPNVGGFDTTYTNPNPTSKWANPSANTTIKNTTTPTTGDNTTIYYGAKADFNQPSGTYTNTIQYTATTNISNIPNPTITSITLANDTTPIGTTAGNTAIKIIGTGFTVSDQSITTAATIDNLACTSISISSNTPTTGQDTIYCNTPAHPTAGAVNVAVTTWKATTTTANGYTYAAPTPTITAPTTNQIFNAGTTTTNLTATTNYPATCYYGTATNPTTQMATTGATTHSQSITGLTNASTNTRYVRCRASSGNTASDYTSNASVTFYVRAVAPTLSSVSPANGTVLDFGTTSTAVSATPSSGTCTVTKESGAGTVSGSTLSGLTNGSSTTLRYTCYAGSGNTQSQALTGTWVVNVAAVTPGGPTATTYGPIQSLTNANCSTTRGTAYDARNNQIYYVQKINNSGGNGENLCWMETNLRYAGDGNWNSSWGWADDRRTVTLSPSDPSVSNPYYSDPGGSTDYTNTTYNGGFYGYHYNWCAAMGGQAAACKYNPSGFDSTISICPAGWRLPTGGVNLNQTDFSRLNTAVGGYSGIRNIWLGVYAGFSRNTAVAPSPVGRGSVGHYWGGTLWLVNRPDTMRQDDIDGMTVDGNADLYYGFSVRCVR